MQVKMLAEEEKIDYNAAKVEIHMFPYNFHFPQK